MLPYRFDANRENNRIFRRLQPSRKHVNIILVLRFPQIFAEAVKGVSIAIVEHLSKMQKKKTSDFFVLSPSKGRIQTFEKPWDIYSAL